MDYYTDKRVQISPHTDAWMQGDRYGVIISTVGNRARVKMDKSQRTLRFTIDELAFVS